MMVRMGREMIGGSVDKERRLQCSPGIAWSTIIDRVDLSSKSTEPRFYLELKLGSLCGIMTKEPQTRRCCRQSSTRRRRIQLEESSLQTASWKFWQISAL